MLRIRRWRPSPRAASRFLRPLMAAFLVITFLVPPRPFSPGTETEAADLQWSDARPPLTDIRDTTAPFSALPAFGNVQHPLAVAPNGHLFAAGGEAFPGSGPRRVFSSKDSGRSWTASSEIVCSGGITGLRVSPRYAAESNSDNTVLVLCSDPSNPLRISRNGGLDFFSSPPLVSSGAIPVSFAVAPDFDGKTTGLVLVGTTGNAVAHTELFIWRAATASWSALPMPETVGGSEADSVLAFAFPPGFSSQALPSSTPGALLRLDPAAGKPGDVVGVTGLNSGAGFSNSTSVSLTFDGQAVAPNVPAAFIAGPASSADLAREAADEGPSKVSAYVLQAVASITLSPPQGPAGTVVTVNGTGFAADATVELRLDCSSCTLLTTAVVDGAGNLPANTTLTVPSGLSGGVRSIHAVVAGSSVAQAQITVTPFITSLSPNFGLAGTFVTINGLGFGPDPGAGNRSTSQNRVDFGGQGRAPDSNVLSWSDFQIILTVSSDTTSGDVRVVSSGRSSNTECFRLSSVSGPCLGGGAFAAQGLRRTIRGSRFFPGETVTLRRGGPHGLSLVTSPAPVVASSSGTFSTFIDLPPNAPLGRYMVFASAASGSDSTRLTVQPALTCISPDSGAAATSITFTGRGFGATQGSGSVRFTVVGGGTTSGIVTSWSDTTVVVQAPENVITGPASVSIPGVGSFVGSNSLTFTAGAAPTTPSITCVSPGSGSGGTQVTITGKGFGADPGVGNRSMSANHVDVGGVEIIPDANVTTWSDTQIGITLPASAINGNIRVASAGVHADGVPFMRTAFTTSIAVPVGTSNGIHSVEAIGLKADGSPSSDQAAAAFSVGELVRIYWKAATRIEEQRAPLTGAWPVPAGPSTLLVATTSLSMAATGAWDGAVIRIPTGAANLDNYWLGLNLGDPNAPSDIYRRLGGATPSFVDTDVSGPGTNTRASVVASGDFATGTVMAGVGVGSEPGLTPRVYKSTDGAQTWGPAVELHGGRGDIGPGGASLVLAPDFASSNTVYAATSGDNGGVHVSNDAGATWTDLGLTNQAFTWVRGVSVFREGSVWKAFTSVSETSTGKRAIFRTENYGPNATWVRVDRHTDITSVSLVSGFPTPNTMYGRRSGKTSQQILKSIGGGPFTPTATDPGLDPIDTLRLVNDQVAFAGATNGKVWRTVDGGATWTMATTDLGGTVMSIDGSGDFTLGPPVAGIVAASALSTTGAMEVWASYDGGMTFGKVGSSGSAWGVGGTFLSVSARGPDTSVTPPKYHIFTRPQNAVNNDVFRAVNLDPANLGAATWSPIGSPDAVKGTGYTSMSSSSSFTSSNGVPLGDGAAQPLSTAAMTFLMGRALNGGPANVIWRTYFPFSVTASTWSQKFLPSVPVPAVGNTFIASSFTSTSAGRLITVLESDGPPSGQASHIYTWTDTVSFLAPPAVTEPVDGATFSKTQTIELRWNPVPLGVTYQYEVSKDLGFTTRLSLQGSGEASCPPPPGEFFGGFNSLAPATNTTTSLLSAYQFEEGLTYYWHVRVCGVNSGGQTLLHPGPWSATRSFTIVSGAAISLTPNNGALGDTINFTLARFGANELVEIRWDNPSVLVAAPTTNGQGSAGGSFKVPAGAPTGLHVVRAVGSTISSSNPTTSAAAFTVNPPSPPSAPTFTGLVTIGVPGAGAVVPPPGFHLDVTIYPPNSTETTPGIAAQTVHTDGQGQFSVLLPDLASGSYDLRVKGQATLSRKKIAVSLPQAEGAPALNFGTLRNGDLNGDDLILGGDYSALIANFGVNGPEAAPNAFLKGGNEAASVGLGLSALPGPVAAGERFSVTVVVEAGTQPVDAVDAFLRFAPELMELVENGEAGAGAMQPGEVLPVVLLSQVNHAAGEVSFSSGRAMGGRPAGGSFILATLHFRALAPLSGEVLPAAFAYPGGRVSGAYYLGQRLAGR